MFSSRSVKKDYVASQRDRAVRDRAAREDIRAMSKFIRAIAFIGSLALTGITVINSPAHAKESDNCRDVVRATASVEGTSLVAKVRAREKAIGEWREKVVSRYGEDFKTWLKSHDRNVNCEKGDTRTTCTAEGFPCQKF
jgi:hypothetical protein